MKILVRLLLAATPWVTILLARADYPIVSRHYAADPAPVEYNNRLYVYVSNDGENGTNESTTPVHHYNFNEVGGTNVADSIGGAPWAGTLPNGGVLGGGQLALASASSQYAKLPPGIVSTLTNCTIALWVNLNSVANWTRIFDFGNNTTTYMFLTPQNGINGVVRFAITTTSSGGEQQISGTSALTIGTWYHVVITLSGTRGVLYVDGTAVGTNNSMTLKPSSLGSTTNNYLGKSQWSDPYLNGAMDEFSIYNVALSADEIATTYTVGSAQPRTATIDATRTYQTIEGLGGALCFYNGWISGHPYKQEIYTNAFAGLNLSMLRLGNWYRYQGTDTDAADFVANANRILGRPVPIYMSSWSPPAFLKSNGQVGNGGTLVYTNGSFAYTNFANYWYDALLAYRSVGVSPAWISIQNEPDWVAGYDSCIFRPTEGVVNGTNYASYSKALDAVYQRLTNLASPPKLLAPEVVHIAYNDLRNYAATMNSNSFYGIAYHLYGDSTDGTADGFINNLRSSTNIFPGKPHFMTEFGVSNMIESATLIHNCLTEGMVSGYNHWNLVWPGTDGGLIQIEFPWNRAEWTNAPPGTPTQSHGWWIAPAYWAMKHFSYFIQPGYKRVNTAISSAGVRLSAFVAPDNLRLVAVFINRSTNAPATVTVNFGSFPVAASSVYQTAGTDKWQPLGALGAQLTLPTESLTTVVLERLVPVGPAYSPLPVDGATGVAWNSSLGWTSGSNAVTHAVYVGVNSNAVAQAMPSSSEFKGFVSTNSLGLAMSGGTTYFWRVDEIAGVNTNKGSIWSFSTGPLPALVHRYSFNESSGVIATDSVGGPGWNGVLPSGGSLSSGQLTLASASQQYVSLPMGIVSTLSNFTIEAWVRLNSTTNWSRIFDFGQNTTTYMFLTPQNGSSTRLRFGITTGGGGGEQQINGTSALAAGVWHHVAVTLNGNTGVLYLNGAPAGTNSAMTLKPSSLGTTVNNYIGKSQYSDPYFNGLIDEFRIYSVALSANEVATTYALGPAQLLSTNTPPRAPDGLTAIAGNEQVTLRWLAVSNAGNYNVKRAGITGGPYTNITNVTATNYTDTGLSNGTNYYYVVSALNTHGESTNSVQVSVQPYAPPDLSASLAGTNLTLSWPVVPVAFVLQSRTNLTSGRWEVITSPVPRVVGNKWEISLPLDGNRVSTYYRLIK